MNPASSTVEAGDARAITAAVKADLEHLLGTRALAPPGRLTQARPEAYARPLPRPAAASITLHVYGGDLDDCQVFMPATPDGRDAETMKSLSFHE